jgi:hypothetical protein
MMKRKRPKPRSGSLRRPLWQALLVAAVCIGLVFGVIEVFHQNHQDDPYASAVPRRPGTFRFEPKPDITAYELALALAPMFGSVDFVERMRPFYEHMPASAKRHWLTPESGPPLPPQPPPAHDHDHPH